MKLIPASRARWMMRIESSWSVLPHAPNIIAPRQSGVTWTPVRPSSRVSMRRPFLPRQGRRRAPPPHPGRGGRPRPNPAEDPPKDGASPLPGVLDSTEEAAVVRIREIARGPEERDEEEQPRWPDRRLGGGESQGRPLRLDRLRGDRRRARRALRDEADA